MALLDPCDCF
jgi:hypothetical protein